MALCAVEPIQTQQSKVANLGKQPVGQEMAAWDNVEGFEFLHDLITLSLDRQAACLSLRRSLSQLRLRRLSKLHFPLLFEMAKNGSTSRGGER